MTEASTAWLSDAAYALLAGTGPDRQRLEQAARLGARAADSSVNLPTLIESFLAAAVTVAGGDSAASAMPLMRQLKQLSMAAVEGYQEQAYAELAQRDGDREQFVADLLTGQFDPGRLAARAQRYGVHLSGRHQVVVARAAGLTMAVAHAVDSALAARFGSGNTLTSVRDNDLVCICAGGLRGVPAELARLLMARLGTSGWQIGVGRSHPGLRGLGTSLDEARSTLDLARRLGFTAAVMHAADLLVFPVLLRDREAITDLVTTVLGPLAKARGGARPLLDTLNVLFEQQGNQTATARVMHISVRAVAYRLERIKALTGYHPGEPTQRFTLHTAVLGARLLGWTGHGRGPDAAE